MGSGGKTKIEVPKPVVYQTKVPEADFDYGKEIFDRTQARTDALKDYAREALGNRRYQRMKDTARRTLELGSYLGSIPADQGVTPPVALPHHRLNTNRVTDHNLQFLQQQSAKTGQS